MMERATYDVPTAARRLGVDVRTAYEQIQATGELAGVPAIRAGRRVLIPSVPLDRLLAGERIEAGRDGHE
jgi:hypothetical protein